MDISHILKILILRSALYVVIGFVHAEGDCDAVLQGGFSSAAIEALGEDRKYFTVQQLEFVDTSLNTYCCKSGDISKELCGTVDVKIFPTDVSVMQSPYYFDHFKFLNDLQVNGVAKLGLEVDSPLALSCGAYIVDSKPLDCTPYVYTTFDLPSPMVCHRNGSDTESGGDARCKDVYGVTQGIDTLGTSLEVSAPSQYRGLFDTFWTSESHLVPLKPSELNNIQTVKNLRFMQLGRLMCEEVNTLYEEIVGSSSFYEKTLLAQGGTIFQRCQRMIRDKFEQSAGYLKMNTYVSMEHQSNKSNNSYRDHIFDSLNAVLQSMSELVSGTSQMLNEMGSEYTNMCST